MTKKHQNISSDLSGLSQLTIDAVKGITQTVESLHSTIAQFTPILGEPKNQTKGVSSLVYKSISTVTDLLGIGINKILQNTEKLEAINPLIRPTSRSREAIVSALNGVLGDHLEKSGNSLAIQMNFRVKGMVLTPKELKLMMKDSDHTVLTILIHGLCMNDLQWSKNPPNYGTRFTKWGHKVIYLHYNSGLHVSENGQKLAHLLEIIKFKNPKQHINIIAHSMGGLVARSACHFAEKNNLKWLKRLKNLVFLGTPHQGALLAKAGHWTDTLLQISPYSQPFAKITKARSNGLTDLRSGYIIEDHWKNNTPSAVKLPKDVHCYAIAASTSDKNSSTLSQKIIGDSLVTTKSALGESLCNNSLKSIDIPTQNKRIIKGIDHMQLMNNDQVLDTLKKWLV